MTVNKFQIIPFKGVDLGDIQKSRLKTETQSCFQTTFCIADYLN